MATNIHDLSDDELDREVRRVASVERQTTAQLLALLIEVERSDASSGSPRANEDGCSSHALMAGPPTHKRAPYRFDQIEDARSRLFVARPRSAAATAKQLPNDAATTRMPGPRCVPSSIAATTANTVDARNTTATVPIRASLVATTAPTSDAAATTR